MPMKNDIPESYFNWLYNLMCKDRFSARISYDKLFRYLHGREFTWIIPRDENRAVDGTDLRYKFACYYSDDPSAEDELGGPCSVLEMLVGLAVTCEENIMDDAAIGDRTQQWFWGMMRNLGLSHMNDYQFRERDAEHIIDIFLNREYEPDGVGGLFTIRGCEVDLRTVEIWYQLCWYLDTIT